MVISTLACCHHNNRPSTSLWTVPFATHLFVSCSMEGGVPSQENKEDNSQAPDVTLPPVNLALYNLEKGKNRMFQHSILFLWAKSDHNTQGGGHTSGAVKKVVGMGLSKGPPGWTSPAADSPSGNTTAAPKSNSFT